MILRYGHLIIYPVEELRINPFLFTIESKWVFLLRCRNLLKGSLNEFYNFWLSLSFMNLWPSLLLILIQIIKCPLVEINSSSFDVSKSVFLYLKLSNQNKQSAMTDPVVLNCNGVTWDMTHICLQSVRLEISNITE